MQHVLWEANYKVNFVESEILPQYSHQPKAQTLIQQFQATPDQSVFVSPSGFIAQACTTSNNPNQITNKKQGTIPMSIGTHIWEIIAVYDCAQMQIGVSVFGKKGSEKTYMQSFTASTIRTITVMLLIEKLELHFYLNGNHNEKKTIKGLEKNAAFVPFVFLGTQGKIAALNPFAQHPDLSYPLVNCIPRDLFTEKKDVPPLALSFASEIESIELEKQQYEDFLKIGNNHIFFRNNKFKLIRPKVGEKEPTDSQLINLFQNSPDTLQSLIFVQLHRQHYELLSQSFNWNCSLSISMITEQLITQFQYYWTNAKKINTQIIIQVPYVLMKQVIVSQLREIETDFSKVFSTKAEEVEACRVLQIVHALLLIDEQLYGMILTNKKLQQQIFNTQFTRVPRIFSQFQRLHTFLDSNNYPFDIMTLIQLGLFKLPGFSNQFRHFINYRLPLENITYGSDLSKILPNEKLFNCLDIPLEITINSIPFVDLEKKHYLVKKAGESNYFTLLNEEGTIQVWNGELALHKSLTYNLRSIEEKGGEDPNSLAPLFAEPIQEQLNSENSESQKSDEEEEKVVPNEDLLNQLYNMGFGIEVSKQALIETQNKIEEAIEKAIAINDQKAKEPQQEQPKPKEAQPMKLKPYWTCPCCTLLNTSDNLKCSICESVPPDEAFEKEETTQVVQNTDDQKEKEAVQVENEKEKMLSIFKTAKIENLIQIEIVKPFKHFLFANTFTHEQQSYLVLNRFSHNIKYLGQFFKASTEGVVSVLTNKTYHQTITINNLINILNDDQNSRFIYETLYPVLTESEEELEFRDQVVLTVDGEIQNIVYKDDIIYINGKTKQWECELFEGNDYKPKLNLSEEKVQFEEPIIQKLEIHQQVIKDQQTISNQPVDDLLKFTAEEISDLAKLNENQEIYFKPKFDGPIVLIQQKNNGWEQAIIETHLNTTTTLELELPKDSKLLRLFLTGYCDYKSPQVVGDNVQIETLNNQNEEQLPLVVFSHKGSQFNVQQCISKICFVQQEVFSTVYSRPEFTFKHIHGKMMSFSNFVIASPNKFQNTGVPLGSGLIFIAENANDLLLTSKFSQFNKELYQEWKEQRSKDIRPLKPWEPVKYFEFGTTQEVLKVSLDTPKVGRYVLLMTLSAKLTDQVKFDQSPLTLNYFVAFGAIIKDNICEQPQQSETSKEIWKETTVQFNGVEVGKESCIFREDIYNNQQKFIFEIPTQQINDITKVMINVNSDKIRFLQVSGLRQKDINQKLLAKLPQALTITNLIHDITKYSEFNQKLMHLIHNNQANLQQRLSAIKVLCKLFQSVPQFIPLCYKDLDVLQFIKLNLLIQQWHEESCVQNFLHYFYSMQGFNEQVCKATKDIINNLFVLSDIIKPSGFIQLLSIIKQQAQQDTKEYYPYLLSHLKQIIKFISKIDRTHFTKLNQMQIYSMLTEEALFSEKYTKLSPFNEDSVLVQQVLGEVQKQLESSNKDKENPDQPSTVATIQVNPKKPILSVIIFSKQTSYDEFIIDLLSQYDVNQFQLVFNTVNLCSRVLRITLWNAQNNQPILDVSLPDWMLAQLTKYADAHQSAMPKSKLNMLKWNVKIQGVRSLRLQITYSFSAAVRTKEEFNQMPKELCIIPQFKGVLSEDANDTFELTEDKKTKSQVLLTDGDYTFEKEVGFKNSLKYQQYSRQGAIYLDSAMVLGIKQKYLILQLKEESTVQQSSIAQIKLQCYKALLVQKQKELKEKLLKNFTKDKLNDTIQIIHKLQQELLQDPRNGVNLSKNLDFLYTYAYEIIKLLIQADTSCKKWRSDSSLNEQEGLKMAQLIYKTFVQQDQGPITEQSIVLLNILLGNLSLKYWILFTFTQYQKLEQDSKVLDTLKQLQLPICQTIMYVHHILKEKQQIKQASQLILLLWEKLQQNQEFNDKEFIDPKVQVLKPLGTLRSTSSQDLEIAQGEKLTDECFELTKLKIFQTLFSIMNWTLQNSNNHPQEDVECLFIWSCNVFKQLKNDELVQFVQDITNPSDATSSDLFQLLLNAIHQNDSNSILSKLKEVIEKLCTPQTIKLIFYCFYTILNLIVRYANENCYNFTIKSQVWFLFVSFVVGQLLQLQINYQSSNDGKQLQRKRSIKQQQVLSYSDFVEKLDDQGTIQVCSIETFQQMIKYLREPRQNLKTQEVLENSLTYWGLLMNLMSRLNTQQIMEYKIYDQLLQIYLQLDSGKQAVLQFRFVEMTKHILEHNQNTEFNSNLIKLIFQHQGSALVEGLLSIVTIKERKINGAILKQMFIETASYLNKHCNIGRYEGVYSCELSLLRKLNFGNKLLQLLVKSECPIKVQILISEIPQYGDYIYQYIHWYVLNKTSVPAITPATEVLFNMGKFIRQIFDWFQGETLLATEALVQLYKFQRELDTSISGTINQMTNILSFNLIKNTQEIFEELNELWMVSDVIVREIAINGNAFEYLLEKTHLTKNSSEEWNSPPEQSPLEEEFGNKLKMLDQSGAQSAVQIKDWQVHKKGVKAKVHVLSLKDEFSEEYILEFQLEKPIELKQIKIGFQSYTPEFNDRILGVPSVVVIEVKNKASDNLWYPIGIMTLIEDEAYSYYSVKVMALNLWRLNSQGTLNQQIKSLTQQPITFIRFIMKKPQVTFMEQISQLSFKQYNNIQIGISFISITGYDSSLSRSKQIQIIQEKTASRLLGKMCSQKFRNTLLDISNNQNIVNQIKKSFKNVSQALQSNESTLSPLFIGLTKYNPEFGDWVLEQMMDIKLEWAHAKMTAEIVLQDKNKQLDRLKRFLEFILSQIKQISLIIKQENEFTQFTLLIEALTYAIMISSKQLPSDPIPLDIEEQDFLNILHAISATVQSYQQCNMIIKLFTTLIKLPQPYVLGMQLQQTGLLQMTQQLLNQQDLYRLKILSILVQMSQEVVNEVQPHLPVIFGQALESLEKTDNLTLQDYFFFLDSSANVKQLQALYCEKGYHLSVYEGLKLMNPTISLLKPIDPLTLNHIVNFIGKITLQSSDAVNELASRLIKDIHTLSQIVDINYVENVLIPLLNFEEKIDFAIDIWDKESSMFVGDIRKLSSLHIQEDEVSEVGGVAHELNGFQAREFTPQYQDSLLQAIQKVVKSNSIKKGGKWVKELEIQQGGQFFNKVLATLQKGPFLIIMYGKNSSSSENCIIGLFSTQKCGALVSEFQQDYYPGEVYPILENGEQFGFTYEKDKTYHLLNNDKKAFGVGMEHANGGSFSFFLERINLTFSDDQDVASVSIGIHDFDLLEQKPEDDYYFDDFWMQRMEIWVYQQPQSINNKQSKPVLLMGDQIESMNDTSTFGYGILSHSILQDKYFSKHSVFNYLSPTPVYTLPSSATGQNVLQCVRISNMYVNEQAIRNQVALKMDSTLVNSPGFPFPTFTIDGIELLSQLTSITETPLQYQAALRIFDAFQSQDGVKQIILAVQDATKKWQNQELTSIWNQYVSELSAFCSVPQFFSYYLKNKKSMELLFQLLAGTPDQPGSDQKLWKEKEMEAVKFIYDTLSDVFRTHNNSEIRIIAIKDNLIQKILDKIAIVSKEKKRVYQDILEADIPQQQIQPSEKSEKAIERKSKKKQGVGYGSDQTGQNQKWNTQEYLDKKKIRSEQLKSLLEIIRNFFNYENWHLNQELANVINKMMFESALLSLLEAAFRSGSLLEMSKDHELNLCYLHLTKTLAKHRNLTPLLQRIPSNYVPRQIESIAELLNNLKNIAQIFISCLKTNELSEKDQISKQIATVIIETDTSVEEAIDKFQCGESESEGEAKEHLIQEILKLPLADSYRQLLKDLRFDYVSFKGPNQQYQHYYEKQINLAATPTPAKLIRLAQEFADMSNSLPVEHTNSIFVRADKDRVDVIKALVMGASGTPYAHGAYLFDIYFEDQYPNTPPKMNLSTTGGGKIRFNPNLYSCGKVCLSLLGTWRGHASENWDPKLSTILQVLVSTQAIIMSEDVYFNEPGFEGEVGQPDGEMKNEAYSNIVRYGNIQYAMIDNIKNPPVGFETIIRRHFYLKKGEIMEEVKKWVEFAETRQAMYMGLVSDHNSSWCAQFKKSKTQYLEMLKEAVAELEKTLHGLQQPSIKEIVGKAALKKKRKQEEKQPQQSVSQGILNIDDVDVTYDKNMQEQILDVSNEQVRDRWSRYIGAMGMDAVKKQASAKVLLSGLGSLGVEIAKNVVLSGVGVFAIFDNKIIDENDLVGQFFLLPSDIGQKRGISCLDKIQQLNSYVRVKLIEKEVQQYIVAEKFDIVILTDVYNYNELICWDNLCRSHSIKLIVANVNAVYGRIINDFGNEFTVVDKNGEDIPDVMIKSISIDGIVELLDGQKSQFEDGDLITLVQVEGMMDKEKSINNQIFKIQTISVRKFKILDDISKYSPYVSNGIAKHVKQPLKIANKSFEQVLNSDDYFDPNLRFSDSEKLIEQQLLHLAYRTHSYLEGNITNFLDQVITFDKTNIIKENLNNAKYIEYYFKIFQQTMQLPPFPPLSAYIGGFVSQEIIKALTNKFTPINQVYYTDCIEVLPYQMWDPKGDQQAQVDALSLTIKDTHPLGKLLGDDLYQKIQQSNLFMVGCGAIGCELLKNFAMINAGIQGSLTITDPDHIETSNLNRQFLFREKHIHKPKSQTAAAAATQMNPLLKGKIIARMDKVYEQSENIFTDSFFEKQSIVANALDNVQARRYVDRRCVKAKTPLLESGTLGPKGHVQCIIPFITESYNSMQDPVEEGDIPYCTLKMFPEETFHCVEFARDKFSKLFSLKPKLALNILDNPFYAPTNPEETKQLKKTIKLLSQKPTSYQECIQWARNKFQKYFINDIKQLLFTYPPDTKTKDGQPFWRLPKRPPKCIDYDIQNPIIVQFISTLAFLRAQEFKLDIEGDWRSSGKRQEVASKASQLQSKEWIPNDQKKKEIEEQVLKLENKNQQEEEQQLIVHDDIESLLQEVADLRTKGIKLQAQDFEKDCDINGHIDFIHSLGNLRAFNYSLDEMDWITVKLKAGRIVPALATTTAVVAGLQTIELVKVLKKCKLQYMKNGFINLAVPIVQLTEPMKVETIKLASDVNVTLWDRWDVKLGKDVTIQQLFEHLRTTYHLEPVNVFRSSSIVYTQDLHKGQKIFAEPLISLLDIKDEQYVDLVINFLKEEQIVKNVPEVRVYFA